MLDIDLLASILKKHNLNFCVGKPSMANSNIYNLFEHRFSLLQASSSIETLAISAGASLAGKLPIVVLDETTLLSSMNVFDRVIHPHNFSFLGFLVYSENERNLMHRIDDDLLLHHIKTKKLDPHDALEEQVEESLDYIQKTEKPFIWTLDKTKLLETPTKEISIHDTEMPLIIRNNKDKDRSDLTSIVKALIKVIDQETAIFTADPYLEESLLQTNTKYLYIDSADGHIAALATGYALCKKKPTIVLDTAYSLLGSLSNMAFIGHYSPKHFLHIIIDDHKLAATGNQRSNTNSIDFGALGQSLSYPLSYSIDDINDFTKTIMIWLKKPESTLIHMRAKPSKTWSLDRDLALPLKNKEHFLENSQEE